MTLIHNPEFSCPYCGAMNLLPVDISAGGQQLVTDCEVCCAPIRISYELDDNGEPVSLEAVKEND